jgi:hypothetical protein
MSNPEEKPAIELNAGSEPAQAVTVVPSHEGEDEMGLRSMTVGRYEEIRRRLAAESARSPERELLETLLSQVPAVSASLGDCTRV